jgi:cytochrome P450
VPESTKCDREPYQKKKTEKQIFSTLLENDNLPPSEKTNKCLIDEGITVVEAGSHSVAWALTVLSYHLLSSPPLLLKLKTELAAAKSNGLLVPGQFEKLPFLTAVVKEALRLSYGVSLRLARISPEADLQYGNWRIPKGTSVRMTGVLILQNPDIFPSPREFKPERWLEDADGRLDKYLVSFLGGSRKCLGITLAWAELYMCVAGLYGEFGSREVQEEGDRGVLELFETDRSDVEIVGDAFFPEVKEESKGLRVKISSK